MDRLQTGPAASYPQRDSVLFALSRLDRSEGELPGEQDGAADQPSAELPGTEAGLPPGVTELDRLLKRGFGK